MVSLVRTLVILLLASGGVCADDKPAFQPGVVSTVAGLRAMPGVPGQMAFALGHSTEGDGGQGLFVWSASYSGADDVGIHVVPVGRSGRGAWVRQVSGGVRPEWFGARCDGVQDDTGALQSAITYVTTARSREFQVELRGCTLRLTAPIVVSGGMRMMGQGAAPPETPGGNPGTGSWLLFDHPGAGINVGTGSLINGVLLERFGTFRRQPPPSPGWAPGKFDYDIVVANADATFVDLMLLNPTKGIRIAKGNAGRLTLERVRGQPLEVGIEVWYAADTFRANNIHFWPFWRNDKDVHAYTRQHLDAFWFHRADNPMLSNVFTIFARSGMRFSQQPAGRVSKLHVVNSDFDNGTYGLWIDSSVTLGITAQLDNISIQGTGSRGTNGILNQGNNSRALLRKPAHRWLHAERHPRRRCRK